jgi:hypothetical protein
VRRSTYLALATTSLLFISSTGAHAQALAPSKLDFTSRDQEITKATVQGITKEPAHVIAKEKSPEQKAKKDIVQAATKEPAKAITKEKSSEQKTKKDIAKAATKEPAPVITQKSAQAITQKPMKAITQKPVQAIAKESVRAFAIEPVRPIEKQNSSNTAQPFAHYSYKTPEGKRESAPVITHYYPKQIVYPFAKIDRHIDPMLLQAATIAQERAHAHSRSRCWHYVKEALLASGAIDSRPKSELAKDAAQDLVSNYGFKKLLVSDPFSAPVGSVLVYGARRAAGHVEIRTRDGFVSDFRSKTPSPRPLLGVYAKL